MRAPAAPPGFYPVHAFVAHVTMAGTEIHCSGCSTRGKLPFPRDPGYNRAAEDFLEAHRLCASAGTAPDPSFRGPERGAA